MTRPGLSRGERVVAHAPVLDRAGTEVLDDDVGAQRQPPRDRLALGLAQVERDRPLAARLHVPPHRRAVLEVAATCAAGRRAPAARS